MKTFITSKASSCPLGVLLPHLPIQQWSQIYFSSLHIEYTVITDLNSWWEDLVSISMLPHGQFLLIVFFPGYETVFFGGEIIFVKSYPFYFILNFPFHIGVEPMNNIVIVSGGSAGTQPSIPMCPFSKLPSHPGHHVTLSRVPCPTCTSSLIFDGSNILPIFNSVTHFFIVAFYVFFVYFE